MEAPPRSPRHLGRLALRLLLVLWASFWAWFVVAVSLGEEPAPPLWIPLAWLGSLGALVVLCWKLPRIGGLVLAATALWAGWYFANGGARLILAAPALLLGLGFLLVGSRARLGASGAWLGLLLLLGACRAPQDPADLPYRTSSILRHEDGSRRRAELLETTDLGGYPCRSWVWWHAEGSLDNLELAADHVVQGHAFPAGTRVFFDEEGRLAHAWLARTTELDGRPCRGRWKIDTAFHPNGRVGAFFPPEDLELDGVWCEASVFHPVYLHASGRLARCRLARVAYVHGQRFERGTTLVLDEHGHPRE
jgi:hypothetical protein